MKSLLIASLPKSMSTPTYRLAAKALSMREPLPKHGEVFSLLENAVGTLYEDRNVDAVAQHFLQYSDSCVIKDVLAPEVIPLVKEHFNVLVVQRPVADIVYLRLLRSPFPWEMALLPPELQPVMEYEPVAIASHWLPQLREQRESLVDGVLWAQQLLRTAAHELCHYDDLVRQPEALWDALGRLGYQPKRLDYSAATSWKNTANARMGVRRTKEYKDIQRLVRNRRPVVQAAWRQHENLF